jgi:hypothetical protein
LPLPSKISDINKLIFAFELNTNTTNISTNKHKSKNTIIYENLCNLWDIFLTQSFNLNHKQFQVSKEESTS